MEEWTQLLKRLRAMLAGMLMLTYACAGCSSIAPWARKPDAPASASFPSNSALTQASFLGAPIEQSQTPDAQAAPAVLLAPLVATGDGDGQTPGPERPQLTIDLSIALRLAGIDNPTINLASEQVREALAGQTAARSMLLPSINLGSSYNWHRGPLQDEPGFLRFADRQSLYVGGGAGTVGASNLMQPGIWLFAHLGDAYYAPLAARQTVVTRRADADAVRNATLLDVATAYLQLVGADARLQLLSKGETEARDILRVTTVFAETGQGNRSDANRATAHVELIRRQMRDAEGSITAASARLARLLNLDTATFQLRTPGGTIERFQLVSEDADLDELLNAARRSRPEVLARSAAVEGARIRTQQERMRPWLPTLTVGVSGGWFGGGSNLVASEFGSLSARTDVTVMAVWTAQNLGFGNRALVGRAGSVVAQAEQAKWIALNQVQCEVAEAQAAAKTAARQIEAAKIGLEASQEGFRLESDRIHQGQGRPIEALDSLRQLIDARDDLLRAIVAYDIAQFQLLVALGIAP